MFSMRRLTLAILVLWASTATPSAQESPSTAPVTVAVREVPPFAQKDIGGNWEGLSVDLWQDVADSLDLEFEWRELTLDETWQALEEGTASVAIAALSLTKEREQRFDFSHPYFVSGLSPAYVAAGSGNAWLDTIRAFLSWEFLSAVGSLALVLLVAGLLIWLFERKANAEEFGEGSTVRGLGDGFWWSAVTMTTVGYGDKAPKTFGGRLVALVWMFVSLIIIASFTASIAASLTANRLADDGVRSQPISELRVGVLRDTRASEYASARGARVRPHAELGAALEALRAHEVDVVIHDAPVLKYRVRNEFDDLEVMDRVLIRDDYGFAFPTGSELRERVNVALLSILHQPVWLEIRRRYLGAGEEDS